MHELYELGEKILKEAGKLKFDEIAISLHEVSTYRVRFAKNQVVLNDISDEKYGKILVCKDQRLYEFILTDFDDVERELKRARHNIQHLEKHEDYAPLPQGPFSYDELNTIYDKRLRDLSEEEVTDIIERGITAALRSGAHEVSGTFEITTEDHLLLTSRNVTKYEQRSAINASFRSCVRVNSEKLYGVGTACSTHFDKLSIEKIAELSAERASMTRKITRDKPKRGQVLLAEPAMGTLVSSLSSFASAYYVAIGMSFFADKLGKKVCSDKMSLVDNPKEPYGIGSRSFDEEGFPTQLTTIIENGTLVTYLHNRLTATKFKARTTANAGWVVPIPWQIRFECSEKRSFNELVSDIKDGIIAVNATYLRFHNYRTGDFSAVLRDGVYRVKNGKILGVIKQVRLADNILRLFKNLMASGKEYWHLYHWWMETEVPVFTPVAVFEDVMLS